MCFNKPVIFFFHGTQGPFLETLLRWKIKYSDLGRDKQAQYQGYFQPSYLAELLG